MRTSTSLIPPLLAPLTQTTVASTLGLIRCRLLEKENETWWRGEKDGKEGVFPAQFVKLG